MSATPANPIPEVPEQPAARTPIWLSIARVSRRKRNVLLLFVIIAAVATAGWRYRISRPDYRFARGQAAIAKRDWRSSDVLATKLESTGYPDLAHLLRAEAFYARKEPELALQECNQIRDEGTIRLRAAGLSGKCLLDMGALAEANRVFSFVVDEEPDNTDGHRGLATVAYELGQMNRAIRHLEQVVRLDPADARPHRLLGEILRDSDDTLNAVNEFQEALRLGAGLSATARAEIQFEIVEGLIQLRRFGEALTTLDACGNPDSEPPYMLALRVEALRGLERRREAIALADRALTGHPDGPFYRLRGQMYLEDENPTAAIPLLEHAVQLSPHHYQSHFLLAQAYGAVGQKSDAARMNARADEIHKQYEMASTLGRIAMDRPWDPVVRMQLAQLCERIGDAKSAAMWRKAAASCPPPKP